jgi:hypothetical protein
MKKWISISAILMATVLSSLTSLQAQNAAALSRNMISISSSSLASEATLAESEISARVLKSFNRDFKFYSPVVWSANENLFRGYFVSGGVQHRVTYNKKGKLLRTVKAYSPEHLVNDVKNLVEETYDGYEISGISEVIIGTHHVYYVNIQSRRKLKVLTVYNGEILVQKQFNLQ